MAGIIKNMKNLEIRKATSADASLILKFITDLAIYEKAENEVLATESDIVKSVFGETSTVEALICLFNNEPIGFAIYLFNYSTWLGKYGLFLEDLYVSPESRGVGAGKALLKHLAQLAIEKDCGRFEWNVLDWNEPAIKFYQSIGAKAQDEWIGYRLDGEALEEFANS
jgi:GNAT superfamily N-acetyltransferase